MGSLDEAKRQQNQRQVVARAANAKSDHLEAVYRERILPKMEFIRSSLDKISRYMNQLDTPIKASYFIEGLGRLDNLVQGQFKVKIDNLTENNEVTLKYICQSEGELNVYIEGKKNVDMYIDLLKENKISFKGKVVKDDTDYVTGTRFSISKSVPVSFKFKVDFDNASIDLVIKNYENLGENILQFSPEAITEDFMKKLAEYIARKNKGFFNLDLSEIERRRIRAKVLYEQQQRAAELEAASKTMHDNEPRKKGFFTRLMGR